MKNIKTFTAAFAAGAAIVAASLLTVAAPVSAATQPAVQKAGTAKTAPQRQAPRQAQRPMSATQQWDQQAERKRAEEQGAAAAAGRPGHRPRTVPARSARRHPCQVITGEPWWAQTVSNRRPLWCVNLCRYVWRVSRRVVCLRTHHGHSAFRLNVVSYRRFRSKDEVVAAALQAVTNPTIAGLRAAVDRRISRGARPVAALFTALARTFANPAFRGCVSQCRTGDARR
jgi:hypothetical protein